VNEDKQNPLDSSRGEGVEEAGVWIRDTLGRSQSGFYHLGYSSANPGGWQAIDELLDSTHLEEFRLVAEGLRAHAKSGEGLVTIVGDDQTTARARTYIAFQLARLLAEGGARVLLVDGEFEEDGPGEWLGELGREGLLDVARYGTSPRSTLQAVGVDRVDLMGVGSYRPRESEPLSTGELQGALRKLKSVWNFVLITAPARNAQGECNPIFSHGDGVLLGLTLRGEARDRFEGLAEDLMGSEVPIFGVMAFPEAAPPTMVAEPQDAAAAAPQPELEPRVRHVGSSPYGRSRPPHQSSILFRRFTLAIGLILVGFVGAWATIQWVQRPSAEKEHTSPRPNEQLAARQTNSAGEKTAAASDSSDGAAAGMSSAVIDSVPPDSLKSAILTPEKKPAETRLAQAEKPRAESRQKPDASGQEPTASEAVSAAPADSVALMRLKLRPENGYALHPWSFPDSVQTLPSLAKLRKAGLSPVVVAAQIPGKGTWYRVIVGNYPSRREALKARSLLLTRPDVDYVGVVRVSK
jgi:septal ring-binding cell division protein DamX